MAGVEELEDDIDDSAFCSLIQKLQFDNPPDPSDPSEQRQCAVLRTLGVFNFQKALEQKDDKFAFKVLQHGMMEYSEKFDSKRLPVILKESLKNMDSRIKCQRTEWRSSLGNVKLTSTNPPKEVTDEEIKAWHSRVMQKTKRIEEKTEAGLKSLTNSSLNPQNRAAKRKLPPSQDVEEFDSPPPPPPPAPASSFAQFKPKSSHFEPRESSAPGARFEAKTKPPPVEPPTIKTYFKPPPKQNQWGKQDSGFEAPDNFAEPPRQSGWQKRETPSTSGFQNYGRDAPRDGRPAEAQPAPSAFKSARAELAAQNVKKYGHSGGVMDDPQPKKRSLGGRRGPPPTSSNKFVPHKSAFGDDQKSDDEMDEELDERLKNIAPEMIKMIKNEIMDIGKPVAWDDIAGLESAKTTIQEIVVWPLLRPDIFTGLRGPPKGILLFGPPGTGKTLIGKCIASQSKSTFFSISASSLTSKWVGEGEKMVRALFAVARCHQPAVIFIDEIDSLLSQRSETEHESSRRIKTEFLVQLDGASTAEDERILVVGATNRPQELDEAARRRLVKRLYVPLPEAKARGQIIVNLMSKQSCNMSEEEVEEVARLADGFSGADMRDLCREAAYGPIRSITETQMEHIHASQVRAVTVQDFKVALQQVRPSVSSKDLKSYEDWNSTYGYGS